MLLALISAVAFATILAVVAGLTLTSASSVAHDLYATVLKRGEATEKDEVRVARIAAFVIGGIAIAAGHPGAEAQHRVPRGARLRGRGLGQPAVADLQPVLAAVQHPRRGLGDLRRPDRLRRAWCSSRRWCPARTTGTALFADHDWSWFPLQQPGDHLDPARLLLRLAGHGHRPRSRTPRTVHRARGPRADRRRVRAGASQHSRRDSRIAGGTPDRLVSRTHGRHGPSVGHDVRHLT